MYVSNCMYITVVWNIPAHDILNDNDTPFLLGEGDDEDEDEDETEDVFVVLDVDVDAVSLCSIFEAYGVGRITILYMYICIQ